jgi:hypothetical protein
MEMAVKVILTRSAEFDVFMDKTIPASSSSKKALVVSHESFITPVMR